MKKVVCPTCKKETDWEENKFRPFCSERCRLMDLGNWASEKYRVPVEEQDKSAVPSETSKTKKD